MAIGARVVMGTLLMVLLLFCIAETEAIVVRTGIASRPIGQAVWLCIFLDPFQLMEFNMYSNIGIILIDVMRSTV
ncbi:hypothetical protein FRX31_009250 [Thalictrum thalictroides]|uniref:Uncharacterized protein n=1 Tax=Thalictrum thalictroides TaxID=46969 RepID=A0A7J6WUR1_THATH|nr:hypothetical protein FRX31_009250 [Thalictrum thalictroides]